MAASDKHRVEIEFGTYGVSGKLICPESGCKPATTCADCGRDKEPSDGCCDVCADGLGDECWIKTWFDNVGVDELLHGNVTVEIDAEWDGETIIANITGVVPAPEQKSEAQR